MRWAFLLLGYATIFGKLQERVVICGVCQNVKKRIPYALEIVDEIGALFEDYRVVIYENNSEDRTAQIVSEWSQGRDEVHFITEYVPKRVLDREIINRVRAKESREWGYFVGEKIARARNVVLEEVMSERYAEYEYVIWVDLDFKEKPAYDAIVEVFQSDQEWDAVLAYGISPSGRYWDWYALRDADHFLGSEHLGLYWWKRPKQFCLAQDAPWKRVYSAFGGCGIYRKRALQGCWYSGVVTRDLARLTHRLLAEHPNNPDIARYEKIKRKMRHIDLIESPAASLQRGIWSERHGFVLKGDQHEVVWLMSSGCGHYPSVCEHVALHAAMIVRGHDRIYINPRLIFRYTSDEHE